MLTIFVLAYVGLIATKLDSIPHYDSIGHFVLYGIWGYLFIKTINKPILIFGKIIIQIGFLVIVTIAIVEEFLQRLSTLRTFSLYDLGWGICGIITAWIIIALNKKNKIDSIH